MSLNWYALAVHPRKEEYVEKQLLASGVRVVCPKYLKTVKHARQKRHVATPLFPGYLFVQADFQSSSWRNFNCLPGSIGLIKFGNRPSRLNEMFVEEYISSVDSIGLIAFEREFEQGERVRALGGPFHLQVGEVIAMSSNQRVKILMEALNRRVEMTLPRRALVVAA